MKCGPHDAREGLEAAIRHYLTNSGQTSAPAGGGTLSADNLRTQMQYFSPDVNLVDADIPHAMAYDGKEHDIAQLLNLRSFLVDRLSQKKGAFEEQDCSFGQP